MITIERYDKKDKTLWDDFVRSSKNGVFFFQRDFMDYHSDRFKDHSLIIRSNEELIALFPANEKEGELISHGGLTFGGVLSNTKMTTPIMLSIFSALESYCKASSLSKIIYKAIPHIYHSLPAEEDLYALFKHKAKLFRRDVTTAIRDENQIEFQQRRLRAIKKAEKNSTLVTETSEENMWKQFWNILTETLQSRHGVMPVHSLNEMLKLRSCFPENIKLVITSNNSNVNAGVLLFVNENNVHAQYICASEEGKSNGSLDLAFDHIIKTYLKSHKYFDFGISTEDGGTKLNEGLIDQKEGFGGRSIVHDFYELNFN